jgi:hypothetical protein
MLLQRLRRVLLVLEGCLAVVATHFVQCLPPPAAVLMLDEGGGGGGFGDEDGGADENDAGGRAARAAAAAGRFDASLLGTPGDLQFFATRMRDTCADVDGVAAQLGAVLLGKALSGTGGARGGGGGRAAGGGGGGGQGGQEGAEGDFASSALALDLLNRHLKAYLANI